MKNLIIAALAVALTGCASLHQSMQARPLVDMKGKDVAQYNQDYRECSAYAAQVEGNVGGAAVAGAVVFGILGAMLGDRSTAGFGAVVGGLSGAGEAVGKEKKDKETVMRECLKGRGYVVLF